MSGLSTHSDLTSLLSRVDTHELIVKTQTFTFLGVIFMSKFVLTHYFGVAQVITTI